MADMIPLPHPSLDQLPTYHPREKSLLAVIETPKGSRNKIKLDEALHCMILSKVLPAGAHFPFDFGFIPRTTGEDGDPLDVLVLMDAPTQSGTVIEIRLAGVIEAKQTDKDGNTERNDRLIGVALQSQEHGEVRSIHDVSLSLLKQIEYFFTSYHRLQGSHFKPIGRHGPRRAERLLKKAMKDYERRS